MLSAPTESHWIISQRNCTLKHTHWKGLSTLTSRGHTSEQQRSQKEDVVRVGHSTSLFQSGVNNIGGFIVAL